MADNYPKNFDPALYLGADDGPPNDVPGWAEWLAGKDTKFPKNVAYENWFTFIGALESFCTEDGFGWPKDYFENSTAPNVLFRKDLTKAFNFVMSALGDDGLKGNPFDLERGMGEEPYNRVMCAYVILQIDNAITGLFTDDPLKVAMGFTFAYRGMTCVHENMRFIIIDERSRRGRDAQRARMRADPKQIEKALVLECWQDWQKKPGNYKSKAAFARDMQNKYEHLTSHKVITDWCLGWEKCNPAC